MFKYVPLKDQLIKTRSNGVSNKAQNDINSANIDYLSMMCGVDLAPTTSQDRIEETSYPSSVSTESKGVVG